MKIMNTSIINVDEILKEGIYPWNKTENDTTFKGDVPGYLSAVTMEIKKADGTYGYTSVMYLDHVEGLRFFVPENIDEYDAIMFGDVKLMNKAEVDIARMFDLCDHDGNQFTGRLVFRGYAESYYDFDEREECILDKSAEVDALWAQYVS